MTIAELIKYIADPLGLNMPTEAEWLAQSTAGICGKVALGAGVVLAGTAFSQQGQVAASRGAPRDPKIALVLLLAGAGVGALAGAAICTSIKLFINDTMNKFASAREAIQKVDSKTRQKMIAEAQKLVRMRQKIDEALKPEQDSRWSA